LHLISLPRHWWPDSRRMKGATDDPSGTSCSTPEGGCYIPRRVLTWAFDHLHGMKWAHQPSGPQINRYTAVAIVPQSYRKKRAVTHRASSSGQRHS
jgi:hypothetical protein